MVISIRDYEKSSAYKFIRDTMEVTAPLNINKLGIKYFLYTELTGCYYINCLVNNDKMVRVFINCDGLKYELAFVSVN